jgi:hypothetical protein
MAEAKVTAPPEVEQRTIAWASEGKTVLYLIDKRGYSALATEDEIRLALPITNSILPSGRRESWRSLGVHNLFLRALCGKNFPQSTGR